MSVQESQPPTHSSIHTHTHTHNKDKGREKCTHEQSVNQSQSCSLNPHHTHTHTHKRQNRKEVRKVGTFSLGLDPLQQFLFSGFHFVACIVPCVCVVPCVLHVRQCEWMNRGGATKDKVGGAGHTTALLSVFFPFFCIIIPLLSLCLSPLIIVRSHFWLSSLYFVSLFHLFIHSQFPLFVLAVFFSRKLSGHTASVIISTPTGATNGQSLIPAATSQSKKCLERASAASRHTHNRLCLELCRVFCSF